jgi:hypothetical protein
MHGRELIYTAFYLSEAALAAMTPAPGDCSFVRQTVINDRNIWQCLDLAQRLAMVGDDLAAAEEAMTMGVSLLFERYGASGLVPSEADCPRAVNRALEFLHARLRPH